MQRMIFLPNGGSFISGKYISISDDPNTDYVIGSPTGIGIPDVRIIETTSPAIDGSQIQQIRYEPRVITDTIHIKGSSRSSMYAKRMTLCEVLSPSAGEGTLFYTNNVGTYKIRAIARVVDPISRIGNYNKCKIEFFCADPYWMDLKAIKSSIFASENAGFLMGSFVTEKDGVFFAAPDKTSTLYNNASALTPVKICIFGPFHTVNGFAKIINKTTGKYITLSQSVGRGEVLIINTTQRNISVSLERDGIVEDGFVYIHPDSDLSFHLAPGVNEIEMECNADDADSQITIEFTQRIIGL